MCRQPLCRATWRLSKTACLVDSSRFGVIVGIVGNIGWQILKSISAPVNCDLNFALHSGEISTAYELCGAPCVRPTCFNMYGAQAATFGVYPQL